MMMFLIMVLIKSFRGTLWVPYKFKSLCVTFTPLLETIVCICFVLWSKFILCFIWQPIQTGQCRVLLLDLPDRVALDIDSLHVCLGNLFGWGGFIKSKLSDLAEQQTYL